MKCPKCGAKLPADAKSCPKCGWKADYAPPGDKPKGKGDFLSKVKAKKGKKGKGY